MSLDVHNLDIALINDRIGIAGCQCDHRLGRRSVGDFVQTYSMVGLINSAIRLSAPWDDAF